jgi:ferredoxin
LANVTFLNKQGRVTVECQEEQTLLQAGLRQGVPLPYGCGAGVCSTCVARARPGTVRDGWPEAPGAKNLKREKGECLLCQSTVLADCEILVPGKLVLSFNDSPAKMREHLLTDPLQTWKPRQKIYEKIEEKFGSVFKNKLGLENLICAVDISMEECEQGAGNLAKASQDTGFRMRYWGRVTINRHNTLIQGDFHAFIRYDLPPEEMQNYFSRKPLKTQAANNTTLATKLEGRTKNNPTQLRVVCDLEGLRSALCASSFETFIRFVKKNRDYRAQAPWDTLMFVDGMQLDRVNFALNSSSRDTYLYIDANSDEAEFAAYLNQFTSRRAP